MKRKRCVPLPPVAVKVLFCIGDLELAFRRVKFFLQVFTTDLNSFSRGKYKEVRSLVSEEWYENYLFRCFGQLAFLASLFFVFFLFFSFLLLRTLIDEDCKRRWQNSFLNDFPLTLICMSILVNVPCFRCRASNNSIRNNVIVETEIAGLRGAVG